MYYDELSNDFIDNWMKVYPLIFFFTSISGLFVIR